MVIAGQNCHIFVHFVYITTLLSLPVVVSVAVPVAVTPTIPVAVPAIPVPVRITVPVVAPKQNKKAL